MPGNPDPRMETLRLTPAQVVVAWRSLPTPSRLKVARQIQEMVAGVDESDSRPSRGLPNAATTAALREADSDALPAFDGTGAELVDFLLNG